MGRRWGAEYKEDWSESSYQFLCGKTVLDLYAAGGRDFTNPYTNQEYVPGVGIATVPGEVAYQPIETDGAVTDFLITARNMFEEIQRIGPLPY